MIYVLWAYLVFAGDAGATGWVRIPGDHADIGSCKGAEHSMWKHKAGPEQAEGFKLTKSFCGPQGYDPETFWPGHFGTPEKKP